MPCLLSQRERRRRRFAKRNKLSVSFTTGKSKAGSLEDMVESKVRLMEAVAFPYTLPEWQERAAMYASELSVVSWLRVCVRVLPAFHLL